MKKIYYIIKPFLPRQIQIILRQALIKWQRPKYWNVWPILRRAAAKPDNWQGWPEDKKFAVVLTHDVELQKGHDRCLQLAEIEQNLGFRSSFNFVPERYRVDEALLAQLRNRGFEIGVHGLNHDGKLYSSREEFMARAAKINQYLKRWHAVGFRSPAMHHNLEWLKALDVLYDASTFDTDPFEPQSDGVGTIFPFIVSDATTQRSYVELPYTLAQDFTLFVLMKEKNIELWKQKVDWIARHGGMVLVNTHPDYISFDGHPGREEFPAAYYIELLDYIRTNYSNDYWHALPREVADFWNNRNAIARTIFSESPAVLKTGGI